MEWRVTSKVEAGLDKMWSNFLTPNSRMVIPAALSIPSK